MVAQHEDILRSLHTLRDFVRWGASRFNEAGLDFGHGTDNAADEARVLVLHALHLDHELPAYLHDAALTDAEKAAIIGLFERRIRERVPVPYLTGEAWFAGLPFFVDERVLIPRSPLAELIGSGFAPWLDAGPVCDILDLCTGSGCIAVACALAFDEAAVDAADLSPAALEVARMNVERYGLARRVRLVESDLFDALVGRRYDLIVSNPPYVGEAEYESLPAEYHREPRLGLAAGLEGLAVVSRILSRARRFLTDQGMIAVEVGATAPALEAAYQGVPFTWADFEHGGEGVFLLSAAQLDEFAPVLARGHG